MNIFINILIQIVGGLGLFLYGMRVMSEAVEEIAGYRLRKLISQMTSNLFRGIVVGGVLTAVLQSSSVTTVMAVGFVNAGLMTLKQSLGVIFGANIGSTVIGWILALEVTKYGLPLLGAGALTYLFNSKTRRRKQGLAIMGLGMIFLGLSFMKSGVKPLRDMPEFIRFFYLFSAESYRGVVLAALTGTILTALLQTSSATVGITMALASQRAISAETAVALILGGNIGTTITAYLASLGAELEAKRVAYAHILIKIIGVVVILPLFYPYLEFVSKFIEPERSITKYIALSHTIFNVGLVIIFLPFTDIFLRGLNRMGSSKKIEQKLYVNECIYKIPSVILEKGREEVLQMLERLVADINLFFELLSSTERDGRVEEIFQGEKYQDRKMEGIHQELTELLNCISSQRILNEARMIMKIADEMESMGDYGAGLAKVYIKIKNSETYIDDSGIKNIEIWHLNIISFLRDLQEIITGEEYERLSTLKTRCNQVSARLSVVDPLEKKDSYADHIVMEILAKYRRINRHIIYIIEGLESYLLYSRDRKE
ncbi:phosphate transporter [Propionigenium maris DSM 9537]|uniref:Phosphate transporter n=1 Tax=Propionigenium maris DSM 9537 TaxID=1123000 RepID=A0A9W6GJP4_9FUSO|nr:Na/Pi cotransporter family protein [Propionigenium maris]GLI55215.1 phosphate transporter [Propionigenium maris DSM 9537]